MNKHLIMALVCAAALLVSATAGAESLKFTLGGSDSAVTDTGYDYLDDDNFLTMGQLGADFTFVPGFWVGVEYDWGVRRDNTFGRLDTTLDIDGLLVNARYEYDVASFFSPYVQAGGGFYHLQLGANFGDERREDDAFAGVFHGLVGVEFHVPKKIVRRIFGISKRSTMGDFTFGFMLEGGYRVVTESSFNDLIRPEPDKKPEPEDRPLETEPVRFGDLDLSGVVMRSALVVRF